MPPDVRARAKPPELSGSVCNDECYDTILQYLRPCTTQVDASSANSVK